MQQVSQCRLELSLCIFVAVYRAPDTSGSARHVASFVTWMFFPDHMRCNFAVCKLPLHPFVVSLAPATCSNAHHVIRLTAQAFPQNTCLVILWCGGCHLFIVMCVLGSIHVRRCTACGKFRRADVLPMIACSVILLRGSCHCAHCQLCLRLQTRVVARNMSHVSQRGRLHLISCFANLWCGSCHCAYVQLCI